MNPNWLGVISAVLAVVGFLYAYRFAFKKPFKTRVWMVIISSIAAIPGASFAVYYAHLFPEMAWYYEFRSIPGSELMMVFVGVAGGLFATLLPRILLILPLFGVVVVSVVPTLKYLGWGSLYANCELDLRCGVFSNDSKTVRKRCNRNGNC
jgi:hypothetical protein